MKKLAVIKMSKDLKVKEFRKLQVAKREELGKIKNVFWIFGSIWEIETKQGDKMIACNINYRRPMKYTREWITEGEGKPEYYEQLNPSLWGWTTQIPEKQKYIEFEGYTSEELKEKRDEKEAPHCMEKKCKRILKVKNNVYICELQGYQLAILQVLL